MKTYKGYKDFEDFLGHKHGEQYEGLDDEMPENYEEWLVDLDVQELIDYANEYADQKLLIGLNNMGERIIELNHPKKETK